MAAALMTLGEVLQKPIVSADEAFLYLVENTDWGLQTTAAVLAESDADGNPPFADEHGLRYAIGMDAVFEIVENAKMQIKRPTLEQLLEAFLYYYDHDAFLNLPV